MSKEKSTPELRRSLTLYPSTTIVVGSVIGSGIFVASAGMAKGVPHTAWILFLWVLGGVMTLFGALSLCELASQMPKTGGAYEYLREIYGEKVGFFYGWANFTIAGAGGVAGVAFLFGLYLNEIFPLFHLNTDWEKLPLTIPYLGSIFPFADMGVKAVAVLLVGVLTVTNYFGVQVGAGMQSVSTSLKALLILGLFGILFIVGWNGLSFNRLMSGSLSSVEGSLWTVSALALSSAFWAYDGWGNLMYMAGEVKDPQRTIPQATLLGIGVVLIVYLAINVAYFVHLDPIQAAAVPGGRIASYAVSQVIGPIGALLISALIVFSAFDCANATILTYARLYFAMANEGDFLRSAARVHQRYRTPHRSLLYQAFWVGLLIVSGSFDLITSMYVFVNWVFYFLMVLGVFIQRARNRRLGIIPRFRLPGYPWVPLTFLIFSGTFVVLTLVGDFGGFQAGREPIIKSLAGVFLVLSGLPFYLLWRWQSRRPGIRFPQP